MSDLKTKLPTLLQLSDALEAGDVSSRELVADCLAKARDPSGEGERVFIELHAEAALAQAQAMDSLRQVGAQLSRWAGIPISLKDLFDVKGQVNRAGSLLLEDAVPAAADCMAIARLRRAGFVFVGRTNMTEFAFSGVGINPHYGTPLNPFDRSTGRIPGGSSSGAAVSVTDGMAAAGIGTDTGGSCRIPAALTGITGYKSTADRVPRSGVYPLAPSLDSVGPLAPGVSCCAVLHDILSGGSGIPPVAISPARLRLAVLGNYVTENLDAGVSQAFERTLTDLSNSGISLTEVRFDALDTLPLMNSKGGIAAAEAYAHHRTQLAEHGDRYDPRVGGRISKGSEQNAAEYIELLNWRRSMIAQFADLMQDFDAIVAPTVPVIAPALADFADDDDYVRLNLLLLRNPSVFNLLDGCAISLPVHQPGDAPVGLMLAAPGGCDQALFRAALTVETCAMRWPPGNV